MKPGERIAVPRTRRRMSLAEYRACVCGLVEPSAEQITDFVQHVCSAHSWYKKLRLLQPGVPFHFYVDPFSGYGTRTDYTESPAGITYLHELIASDLWHYSMLPTEEYRRRFGHLAYYVGPPVPHSPDSALDPRFPHLEHDVEPPVLWSPDGVYELPGKVLEAGQAELTSLIYASHGHPRPLDALGFARPGEREGRAGHWPEETGGAATLRQIYELRDRWTSSTPREDLQREMEALVLPEVQRLRGAMAAAIKRMLALAYESDD